MDFCIGTSPNRYRIRFIYTGEVDTYGGCVVYGTVFGTCSNPLYQIQDYGNGPSANTKRWWHTELNIRSKNPSLLPTALATIKSYDTQNVNSHYQSDMSQAYSIECLDVNIPVPAFSPLSSPGYFVFTPTAEELANAMIDISTVDDIINANNSRILEYRLLGAYNPGDTDCSVSFPVSIDLAPHDITVDILRGVFFNMPFVNEIDRIGCCDLEIDNPELLGIFTTDAKIGNIYRCGRVWTIGYDLVDSKTVPKLFYFDALQDDFPFTEAGIVKGCPVLQSDTGCPDVVPFDLTWDNKRFLWVITSEGLRKASRVLSDDTEYAILMSNSIITKNQSSFPDVFPFIFDDNQPSEIGKPSISFSYINNRLYASTPGYFFEFEARGDNAWEMMKFATIPSPEGSSSFYCFTGLSFSPNNNNCYAVYNNKLVTVNYQSQMSSGFGSFSYVSTNSLPALVGIDFVDIEPDESANPIYQMYGLTIDGYVTYIDEYSGSYVISDSTLNLLTSGTASCLPGDDLSTYPFPFYPGAQPWCFVIDISNSMANNNAISRVKEAMLSFIDSNVFNGDVLSFILFNNNSVPAKFLRQMRDEDDVQDAIDFINNNMIRSGDSSNLCGALDYISQPDTLPSTIKSVVVISNGAFTDCSAPIIDSLLQKVLSTKPDTVFYAVATNAANSAYLEQIGNYNGGGYTEWND